MAAETDTAAPVKVERGVRAEMRLMLNGDSEWEREWSSPAKRFWRFITALRSTFDSSPHSNPFSQKFSDLPLFFGLERGTPIP